MHHLTHLFAAALLDSLSFLFAVGGIGCCLVLLMTFWEDVRTIAGR